jgi:hypothetical protein
LYIFKLISLDIIKMNANTSNTGSPNTSMTGSTNTMEGGKRKKRSTKVKKGGNAVNTSPNVSSSPYNNVSMTGNANTSMNNAMEGGKKGKLPTKKVSAKIHTGSRGGRYYIKSGEKKYI